MAKNESKNWIATWETNSLQHKLPAEKKLKKFLDEYTDYSVFQLERGKQKAKKHFQIALVLKGSRKNKKNLLDLFRSIFNNIGGLSVKIAHSREAVFNYCSKEDTRVGETIYAGFKEKYDQEVAQMELRPWQEDLFNFIKLKRKDKNFRDRKIVWVEDRIGNTGKSAMLKYLRVGQKDLVARKLSVNSVDRLISGVTKVTGQEEIDLFMIDFTRTQGKDQNYEDLFAAIEEIKNGYVVDMMYGKYEEAIFRPPMIVIFTNQEMKNYKKYLSTDRWVRFVINSDKDLIEYEEGVNDSYSPALDYITPFKVHEKYKLRKNLSIEIYQAEVATPPDSPGGKINSI